MTKMPMLPLWTDSYLNDTPGLSLEEHGAYLKLLIIAWRSPACAIPNDDARICRMLGITPRRWAKLKPIVMSFWTLNEVGWTQKRLLAEYQKATEKSELARDAAERRWNGKTLKNMKTNDANAEPTHCQGTSDGNALSSLTDSIIPDGIIESRPKRSRRLPEIELSADWQPTDDHQRYASDHSIDVHREAEKFRNHAAENQRRARRWDAAFARWLINAVQFTESRPSGKKPFQPAGIMAAGMEVLAAGDAADERARSEVFLSRDAAA